MESDLTGHEQLPKLLIAGNAGGAIVKARATTREGERWCTTRDFEIQNLGGKPRRLLRQQHGAADLECDLIRQNDTSFLFWAIVAREGKRMQQEVRTMMDKSLLMNLNGPWSNTACRGYCLIAMRRAGVNMKTQEKVLRELELSFDGVSIEDAEKAGLTQEGTGV